MYAIATTLAIVTLLTLLLMLAWQYKLRVKRVCMLLCMYLASAAGVVFGISLIAGVTLVILGYNDHADKCAIPLAMSFLSGVILLILTLSLS